jgi:hypothetical protein
VYLLFLIRSLSDLDEKKTLASLKVILLVPSSCFRRQHGATGLSARSIRPFRMEPGDVGSQLFGWVAVVSF